MKTFSLNNRLVVEVYVSTGLTTEIKNGLATPGQRDGIKALRVLVGTVLSDGRVVEAGDVAFIREENLYNQPWTKKVYKCPSLTPEPFHLADLIHVDAIGHI